MVCKSVTSLESSVLGVGLGREIRLVSFRLLTAAEVNARHLMSHQSGCSSKKLLFGVEVPTLACVLVNNSIFISLLSLSEC